MKNKVENFRIDSRHSPLLRVLVIEDNEDDEELLKRQLIKSGMIEHVKFIRDGKEAWDFLYQDSKKLSETIMVIFLDLKLPGLGGLDLLGKLRNDSHLRRIPISVMTSSNDPQDLNRCTELDVDNYIEKPVTFSSFSKAIADVFHTPQKAYAASPIEVPLEYLA